MMKMRTVFASAIPLFLVLVMSWSASAVPNFISYQGSLTDPSTGDFISETSLPMSFRIYDEQGIGTGDLLWEEYHASVSLHDGLYHVLLGSGDTQSGVFDPGLFSQDNRWLEVWVAGERLEPRQQVTSVAFAMQADSAIDADFLDGRDSGDFASYGHAHAFSDIAGTAADSQIPDDISIQHANTANSASTADSCTSAMNADTVDGEHASAFALEVHNHSATSITSGTLSTSRYSAYSDLSAEGRLDNNADGDLPTRTQGDARYLNTSGDTMTGTLIVDDVLSVEETLYVGTDNGSDDDYIRMDSPTTEYLMWDEDPGRFHLSDELYVEGSVKTGSYAGYNSFGWITPTSGQITNGSDVVIGDDLEIHGTIYAGGTHYLSIPAAAFIKKPTDSPTWTFSSSYAYSASGTSSLSAYAPIYLPQNAVITQVLFYYRDNNASNDVSLAGYLYEKGLLAETSEPMIGDSNTTSAGASTIVQTLPAGTIYIDTIDNQNNSYVAHVSWTPEAAGSSLRFYGCRIRYTVSQLTP